MKKTFLTFIVILVGLYVAITLLDGRSAYVAEKIVWDANRKLARISKNPEAIPDSVYKQLADRYAKVINQYGHTPMARQAAILIGNVYLIKKDYSTARQHYLAAYQKFSDNPEVLAEATLAVGKTYELDNNWPEAEKYYEKIITKFPTSEPGMLLPIFVANHYKEAKDQPNAERAVARAIGFYTNIAADHPGTPLELRSLNLLANFYIALNRWSQAVDLMGDILLKYPTRTVAPMTTRAINQISMVYLSDPQRPIGIYKEFLAKYPDHPMAESIKEMIKNFETFKDKNLEVKLDEAPQ